MPPGAYRAAKPVDLNGDFMVKIQANTQIDGGQFHGRSGVQQWVINGSSLRHVAITGKRNANGQAVDSAFEDFEFNKDDNWYNFWWSTRWYFKNCIFTKRLLRGDLPPLDYSVHAEHCTFYGVMLPPVGFKENAAGYMGKDEMVFAHCRFVDCDVPQTFLASTVDCVFEHCRFEAKNHVAWPKETTSIKVVAYYAGDTVPASYTNGPFSVEFQPEPMGGGRGSTVPHTQSGGRITLTNLRLSGSVAAMGTTPLKASQLAEAPRRRLRRRWDWFCPRLALPNCRGRCPPPRPIRSLTVAIPPRSWAPGGSSFWIPVTMPNARWASIMSSRRVATGWGPGTSKATNS